MKNNFAETLKEMRIRAGYSQKEVYEMFNIRQSTFSAWETGRAEPSADMLLKLCKLYNINDIFAAFGYDGYNDDGSIQLNLKEIEHIEKYRALDQHGQETVSYILNRETERVKQIEQAAATVVEAADSDSHGRILQYFHSVSAGAGEVIFDDVYSERITVPDRPQYRRVAYAVKVSGHSMEPLYHDNDILLVEPTCEISVGEIGIFNVNGQAYVKKLGNGVLISLNKGYNDIPLTEESLCMGRVVDSLKS